MLSLPILRNRTLFINKLFFRNKQGVKSLFLNRPERMSTVAASTDKHSAVFVTAPDEQIAKTLAKGIVEGNLAACVNIVPKVTSIYVWEGKINEDSEVLLMIKTRASRVNDLSKYVREHHPYSVAEVISVPIENGNQPYLDWISKTVPEK